MSTDPARLTDDEREDLWRAFESWTEGDFSEHMGEAVEGILGKRLAKAWEEGWHTGQLWAFSDLDEHDRSTNPYRVALEGR